MGARVSEIPLPHPESKLVTEGKATIREPLKAMPRRKMFRCTGYGEVPGFYPICMDTRDPETQVAGLKKRLLRDVPAADPLLLGELKGFVQQFVQENFPKIQRPSFEGWLETAPYTEARKQELREAHESLHGGRPTRKEASRVSSFGKSESYEAYKHLRWINSRTDAVKSFLGPYFKAIEGVVYELPWFIKHTPVPERPAKLHALMKAGRRYYFSDYTAYESHFTPEVMDAVECVLYRHCLADTEDADFVCNILMGKNRLATRLGVQATLDGRRMSGDMCTSLGNGFTNLMLALFLAHRSGAEMEGFVEGDDGVFSTNMELSSELFEKVGFTIKLVEVTDPLSGIPVDTGVSHPESWARGEYFGAFCGVLCSEDGQQLRDPRKFFSTFAWTLSCIHAGDATMKALARSKALSAVYETPHCPLVSVLARHVLKLTKGVKARAGEGWEAVNAYKVAVCDEDKWPEFNPTDATRALFARLFSISIPAQLEVERRFRSGDFFILDLVQPHPDMTHYGDRFIEWS